MTILLLPRPAGQAGVSTTIVAYVGPSCGTEQNERQQRLRLSRMHSDAAIADDLLSRTHRRVRHLLNSRTPLEGRLRVEPCGISLWVTQMQLDSSSPAGSALG